MAERRWLMGMLLLAAVAGCSRSGNDAAGGSAPATEAPRSQSEPPADLARLYDPTRLVELRSLRGFPPELRELVGANAVGHARMADVGEECSAAEVAGGDPGRCFLLGGISKTSAIVAFKAGGNPGPSQLAEAFVRTPSGWTVIRQWKVGAPGSLAQLLDMTRLAEQERKAPAGLDSCFRVVDGRCSY